MSFGSSQPPPTPQPVTPVPQRDDPSSYEARRSAAARAKDRMGIGSHLLTGDPDSVSTDSDVRRRPLLPG